MVLFYFVGVVLLGLMAAGIVSVIYDAMDLSNTVSNITLAEDAMWTLIPVGIMMIFFGSTIYGLISKKKGKGE